MEVGRFYGSITVCYLPRSGLVQHGLDDEYVVL